jgi:hypothetical protein
MKREWSDYVEDFIRKNPRIPTDMIVRGLMKEANGVDDSGIADNSVVKGGDPVKNQANCKEAYNGDGQAMTTGMTTWKVESLGKMMMVWKMIRMLRLCMRRIANKMLMM